jgi:hypothetical protein
MKTLLSREPEAKGFTKYAPPRVTGLNGMTPASNANNMKPILKKCLTAYWIT